VPFQTALIDVLSNLDQQPDELEMDDAIARIAACLSRQSGAPGKRVSPVARSAVLRARDFLDSHSDDAVGSGALEAVTGLDRYELARQFRRVLGTSPHRYLIMRRLDRAKRALATNVKLADAAVDAGFADQAHFTRHFRSAFGLTPGRWMAMQS
jgi:AraC-like DNA-binding protein